MNRRQEMWSDFPALRLVRTGRVVRFFAKATFFTLVLSIVAMFLVPWRQTARGIGTVVALDPQQRPQPVLSPTKGIISFVEPGLREGSFVEKDDLLIRLAPLAVQGVQLIDTQIITIQSQKTAAESSLAVAEQAVQLQASAGRSMTESLDQEYQAAEQKYEQTKNEVLALQAELVDKRNQLRIAEEVAQKGLVSREELVSKQQAVEVQIQKVNKAESAVAETEASLRSKQEEIESKKREIDIKNQNADQYRLQALQKLASIKKELIDLETKRGELDRLEIRAPRSGYIQQWYGLEGSDTVKEGDQLFVIVPQATELAVEMSVSGNDMPLISAGDRVRLQFEGWPAVQFVGWPSVAVGTFGGKVNRVFPTDDGKGNFRVVVSPDRHFPGEGDWPDDRYLRQGVRANGWVLLREVRLGYEVWRQLNGFPPVVADQAPDKSKGSKVNLPKV